MKETIRGICERYAKDHGFSGACMVKTQDEIVFAGAYGFAHKAFKIPNRVDTKFDTASVTKTFTAVAILQLIEKGLLSFSNSITEIIDLKGTKIPKDVTIEHLLNHTSGIADDADEEAGEDYADLFRESPNYAIRECKDFLKNFAYKEPNFKAGTCVRYNNCAFILLGLAIEKITGVNYRTYVKENIFDVCRMKNTEFCSMDEVNENTAEGYFGLYGTDGNFIKWKKNIYSYPPKGTPDGGAYTTVEDLDIFIRAIKADKLLSEEYTKKLLSPNSQFERESPWNIVSDAKVRTGYAFEFLEIGNEVFCIFKEGCNNGVGAMFTYYPKVDLSVSILSNQDCDVWEMHREIQTEIYNLKRLSNDLHQK